MKRTGKSCGQLEGVSVACGIRPVPLSIKFHPIREEIPFRLFLPTPPFHKLASSGGLGDFYELLSVSKDASTAEIKIAYHKALLQFHPDKTSASSRSPEAISISLIKEAYLTLSTPHLRAQYSSRKRTPLGPRPAQIISLEEFEEVAGDSEEDDVWCYKCRCGGEYRISSGDMERGHHLVGCNSCSEAVWVGYELQESDEDDNA
jgi:diphthamide biosynthesis protein 4